MLNPSLNVPVHINDNTMPGDVMLLRKDGKLSGVVVATEDGLHIKEIVSELNAVKNGKPLSGRWRFLFVKAQDNPQSFVSS